MFSNCYCNAYIEGAPLTVDWLYVFKILFHVRVKGSTLEVYVFKLYILMSYANDSGIIGSENLIFLWQTFDVYAEMR